jgi:hypothetical protein
VDSSVEEVLTAVTKFKRLQRFTFRPVCGGNHLAEGKTVYGGTFWYIMSHGSRAEIQSLAFGFFDAIPSLLYLGVTVTVPASVVKSIKRTHTYTSFARTQWKSGDKLRATLFPKRFARRFWRSPDSRYLLLPSLG